MSKLNFRGVALLLFAGGALVGTGFAQSPESSWQYDEADVWAFRPVKKQPVPEVPEDFPAANPIDPFVLARMLERGVAPAPEADSRTLVRRLFVDLLGLPPTADDIERFEWDQRPDRWSRLVDRLLASPRYGEQWARHWLDVVRYADTAGFSNDFERPNAWRYRDYVIRSFNADKPYNRFVLEQIAGDELDPDDPEMKIAVGYLRMGPGNTPG